MCPPSPPTTTTTWLCSRPDQIFIMSWKLFENCQPRWEFCWESVQWFMPTDLPLLSVPMMWWQIWKLSSFKMDDLRSTCRFWLTHSPAQPLSKDCCVLGTELGTSLELLEGGAEPSPELYWKSPHITLRALAEPEQVTINQNVLFCKI